MLGLVAHECSLCPYFTLLPLINDMLAEELELVVESFGRGLWRFRWEPAGRLRESELRP